jgi:hypothetical protein
VADVFEEYLKPAGAKTLGMRVRDIADAVPPSPESSLTGPTLAEGIKKRFAWPTTLIILTAVVLVLFLKITEMPVDTGVRPEQMSPVPLTPAQADMAPTKEIILDQASVLVNTVPAGALIQDGDISLGNTPVSVTIPSGVLSRRLTVTMDRYKRAEVTLTRDDRESGVMIALTELPTGTMRIGAIPWARVHFMGKDRGITPVVMEETPVGKHSLVLTNDELGMRKEVIIRVSEGENPAFVLDMATGKRVQSPE